MTDNKATVHLTEADNDWNKAALDYARRERQALLQDSPEFRHALKVKRAIAWLGHHWLGHPSRRWTRDMHRAARLSKNR